MLNFLEAFLGYKESPLAPAMKAMLDVKRPANGFRVKARTRSGTMAEPAAIGASWVMIPKRAPEWRLSPMPLPRLGWIDIGMHLLHPTAPLTTVRKEVTVNPAIFDGYVGRYLLAPSFVLA